MGGASVFEKTPRRGREADGGGVTAAARSREQNSAGVFRRAVAIFNSHWTLLDSNLPPAMEVVAPGKAMAGWARPKAQDVFGTNSWEEVGQALAQLREGLDLLHRIIERPVLNFDLPYENGPAVPLSHLAPLKRSAQYLDANALYDLHDNRPAESITNAVAMLALVQGVQDEPVTISQLFRFSIAQRTLAVTWEILRHPDLKDEQLALLQQAWASLDFLHGMENAMSMERAKFEQAMSEARNSPERLRKLYGLGGGTSTGGARSRGWIKDTKRFLSERWEGAKTKSADAVWVLTQSYQDELQNLRGMQVVLDSLRKARADGAFKIAFVSQTNALKQLGFDGGWLGNESDLHEVVSTTPVTLSRVLYRIFAVEVSRRVAVTAIALERYRLKHGAYPSALYALVPDFVPSIPSDPADGLPLRYQLKADGTFLLYSIGEDGEDNHGDPTRPNNALGPWQSSRDWVWPQVATPEEIESAQTNRFR